MQFKFRAWVEYEDRDKFIYPQKISFMGSVIYVYDSELDYEHQIDPKYLQMWTGLKDKNGKEIYEGDIIRHSDYGQISVVEWSSGDWGWLMRSVKNWNPKSGFDSSKDEVIGNIYFNPELLKESK